MGLLGGGINEVIATTTFNAAPIGIHYRDKRYHAVLFLGSHTEQNVSRDGWLVANIVHDPVLYVKTAFEDLHKDQFIEEPVNGKIMHRLAGADAWAAFTATVEHRTAEAITVSLTPEKELIENVAVHPINRGFNSLIDATVHATRYRITRDIDLKKHIEYHAGLVRKCGGKREIEALAMLEGYIG
ncbi:MULTISPECIES: DUF447 domain-containing protein [unclassified Methanoregula]|uniref:DUF447 domain-containing protein n=1 Tax=unclassified Methanoregula TaxID=2649730 RepID=UPI0009C548E1|nr:MULTISPECIES: DUF447 domain-containing protein [unclassified Methanoregula]OPX65393.1 MAG: hypothetical protein A4E33_00426 [Methanoregula sp. PtaB.Bin085]OPY32302.1 MAG: hypothetical protein A4E34_02676 [Methanoregula sp. PtaU1.Bin006]